MMNTYGDSRNRRDGYGGRQDRSACFPGKQVGLESTVKPVKRSFNSLAGPG
jgi:hypothetical protein